MVYIHIKIQVDETKIKMNKNILYDFRLMRKEDVRKKGLYLEFNFKLDDYKI